MLMPQPIHALRRALIDPARRERAVLLSLGAYVVLWAIYGTVAKGSQGLHPDMTELIAWSRDLAWGYKHPPLAALIVRIWFSVLPVAEWSYYLLAMLMPAIALWIAWRLSADYLDIEKRVAGLALLMFIPFFNFHALKFNVNTVLMPLWAVTTLWFLRGYKPRSRLYAAFAGIGAAGCMLGKYWSVFLLAGLALAALIDKRRADYFRSAAPWITIAVGLAVLAPHLLWLYRDNFAPFEYAVYVHGAKAFSDTATAALGYLAGSAGYAAVPVIIVLAVARPSRATIADMAWPAEIDRKFAATAFWGPLLLPAVGALAGGIELTINYEVNVGLDAAAGVAGCQRAGDDGTRSRHAPRPCRRRSFAVGDAGRLAPDCHHRAAQRSAAGHGAIQFVGERGRAPLARDDAAASAVCRRRCRSRQWCYFLRRRPAARIAAYAAAGCGRA